MTGTLDPMLAARLPLLEGVPSWLGPMTPEQAERAQTWGVAIEGYVAPSARVADRVAPGPHGDVPVRVYAPTDGAPPTRGVVWCHGGAFVAGDLDMPEADVVARELVVRSGALVVSVDYRLAVDGVHFPVPHDDVHAAYLWAVADSGLLPAVAPWALGGASAGANLSLGVAQRLRDEGAGLPDCLLLAYPVVHFELPPASPELERIMTIMPGLLRFPPEGRVAVNANYLGGLPPGTPYAFPGLGRLGGLPRTLVMTCEFDDLRPSGERLVVDLRQARVEVLEDFVEGAPHGHLNIAGLPSALASIDRLAAFAARGGAQDAAVG